MLLPEGPKHFHKAGRWCSGFSWRRHHLIRLLLPAAVTFAPLYPTPSAGGCLDRDGPAEPTQEGPGGARKGREGSQLGMTEQEQQCESTKNNLSLRTSGSGRSLNLVQAHPLGPSTFCLERGCDSPAAVQMERGGDTDQLTARGHCRWEETGHPTPAFQGGSWHTCSHPSSSARAKTTRQ